MPQQPGAKVGRSGIAAGTLVWPAPALQTLLRWKVLCLRWWSRRPAKPLRLIASLSLGDRRFAGILEVEGRRFLIGTTPQTVTLLGELQPTDVAEPSQEGAA